MQLLAVLPVQTQSPPGNHAADVQQVGSEIFWVLRGSRGTLRAAQRTRWQQHGVELPQVIEADLRCRQRCELLAQTGILGEIAKHAIANATVGDAPQLLLDAFETIRNVAGDREANREQR